MSGGGVLGIGGLENGGRTER